MSDIGKFQDKARDLIGEDYNFSIDTPHADKPEHVDLTKIIPNGADKAEINFDGDIIGGSTQIGPINLKW